MDDGKLHLFRRFTIFPPALHDLRPLSSPELFDGPRIEIHSPSNIDESSIFPDDNDLFNPVGEYKPSVNNHQMIVDDHIVDNHQHQMRVDGHQHNTLLQQV
jgi:hypothetical protein